MDLKEENRERAKTKERKEKVTTTTRQKAKDTQTTIQKGKGQFKTIARNYNNYNKGRGKGKGSKNKSTFDNIPPLPPYKGKGSTKGKGMRTNVVCYYCGKPKCWWKEPIYSIDLSTPMWSVPNDVQS
eukprot:4424191-Amphidinium_carterae.2